MLYGHGDNGYAYPQDIRADFSSNVWYGEEPAGLKEHLFREWKRINRYPQVLAESLRERISRHHGLEPANVLVCSGATEGIYLAAQAYREAASCILVPSFAEYEDACRLHAHRVRFLSFEDPALPASDLVWIGHPNNPTGTVHPSLETWIRENPDTLFVVDEAFIEFTEARASLIPLIPTLPNLLVLRSMTKAFVIPGLRLGYAVADRAVIKRLQQYRLPWSVNAMAAEAGNFILDHHNMPPLDTLLRDKALFAGQMDTSLVTVFPSATHFFLCEVQRGTAEELQRFLLERHRLLIRDAGNFRGLSARHFRVATLAPETNQLLITALRAYD